MSVGAEDEALLDLCESDGSESDEDEDRPLKFCHANGSDEEYADDGFDARVPAVGKDLYEETLAELAALLDDG